MSEKEREYHTGLDRNDTHLVAHIYEGPYGDLIGPLCARGWNRENGFGFSIFRNNVGDAGVCKICQRREAKGLGAVEPRERPYIQDMFPTLTPDDIEHVIQNAEKWEVKVKK